MALFVVWCLQENKCNDNLEYGTGRVAQSTTLQQVKTPAGSRVMGYPPWFVCYVEVEAAGLVSMW